MPKRSVVLDLLQGLDEGLALLCWVLAGVVPSPHRGPARADCHDTADCHGTAGTAGAAAPDTALGAAPGAVPGVAGDTGKPRDCPAAPYAAAQGFGHRDR